MPYSEIESTPPAQPVPASLQELDKQKKQGY